jgi:MFS family permease
VPRDFYLYLVSRFASGAAVSMMRTIVAWHIYNLSHSAFHLGLVGIVQFVPALVLSLVGGAVADSFDRRRVINVAQLVSALAGSLLFLTTQSGHMTLPMLYACVLVTACANSFEGPARAALLPQIVGVDRFQRAVTISSTNQALAFASGPALGGALIAAFGITTGYAVVLVLIGIAFVSVLMLRVQPSAVTTRRRFDLEAIREGLAFVWNRPVVLGCMTLDMFAVIFGGATALLPIYAKDILHVGARGYGLLTSSLELGALTMALILVVRPPIEGAGRTLLAAVACYGVATITFGLSRSVPLSIAAYMAAGMADQVSVVLRSTVIQLSTPDALRGRVSAVNLLFIGASNQLGAAESGFMAQATNPTFSVVSGGIACLCVVAIVAWRIPELSRYHMKPAHEVVS